MEIQINKLVTENSDLERKYKKYYNYTKKHMGTNSNLGSSPISKTNSNNTTL